MNFREKKDYYLKKLYIFYVSIIPYVWRMDSGPPNNSNLGGMR